MSTTRKIAHNTLTQLGGKILTTTLGLVALGMMTRYLGNEQYGWYTSTIAFLQFIGIITDFGLTPVTSQMMSEPNFDKPYLLRNLIGFRLTTTIAAFALAPLLALFFPYPPTVKIAIAFTAISFIAIALNQIFLGFYQTRLEMHVQAIGELIGRIVLVISVWLLIREGASFLPIMGAVALASMVYTFVVGLHAARITRIMPAYDPTIWRSIVAKSWPISISIICNVVYLKGDVGLMQWFVPQNGIGIYGAAYRVLDVVTQSGMMMMGLLLPILAHAWSRGDRAAFAQRQEQAFNLLMLFALPLATGAAMLATPLMVLVAGSDFAESGRILAILSLAIIGVYFGAIFGHIAVAINRQKQTIWIYLSNAVLTFTGYAIFIPHFGIYGAAWMSVFSELYAGLLLFLVIRYYSQIKLEFKTMTKIIFSCIVMASILFLSRTLPLLVKILLGVVSYGITLIALGGISRQTLREVLMLKNKQSTIE